MIQFKGTQNSLSKKFMVCVVVLPDGCLLTLVVQMKKTGLKKLRLYKIKLHDGLYPVKRWLYKTVQIIHCHDKIQN